LLDSGDLAYRSGGEIFITGRAKDLIIKGGRNLVPQEVEEVAGTADNHLGETASATLGREIDYTLGENSEEVLSQIDAALRRVEDGTYGTCVNCGREIAPERLEATPWAALCIDCKREAERG